MIKNPAHELLTDNEGNFDTKKASHLVEFGVHASTGNVPGAISSGIDIVKDNISGSEASSESKAPLMNSIGNALGMGSEESGFEGVPFDTSQVQHPKNNSIMSKTKQLAEKLEIQEEHKKSLSISLDTPFNPPSF